MDRREHHRVQLRIPARLRWTTPLGQKTEVGETWNVSRGGLLVPCQQTHTPGTPLWVTFPYDATLPIGQPEVLARVVRSSLAAHRITPLVENVAGVSRASGNSGWIDENRGHLQIERAGEFAFAASAALRFEYAAAMKTGKYGNDRESSHGNGNGHAPEVERRSSPRRPVAVPIRVRPAYMLWFEQTMTVDASSEGLRFFSCREYKPGDHLIVCFEDAILSPWPVAAEFRSLVVRVDPLPRSPSLIVTIYRGS